MRKKERNLNIEFDKVEREFRSGIEGEDGVFLEGRESWIRRLQHVHAVTSMSHNQKLWDLEGA